MIPICSKKFLFAIAQSCSTSTCFIKFCTPFSAFVNNVLTMMCDESASVGASISQESESLDSRRKSDESKSSGETFSNTSRANTDPNLQLGAHETRIVRKSKVCVYIFLLLAAIIGSLSTWYFLTAVEQQSVAQQVRCCIMITFMTT